MEFRDFYKIARYGNIAWKGSFSESETAENAHIYTSDLKWSKENDEIATSIKELYKLLITDGSEECLDWAFEIAMELGLIDMNYMDFMDTDPEILKKFMEH